VNTATGPVDVVLSLPPPQPTATATSATNAIVRKPVAAKRVVVRCGIIGVSGRPV